MIPHFILQGLFLLAGMLSLLAALFNWNWFFKTNNAQSIVRAIGAKGARWFYAALGLVFIGGAIFFYLKTIQAFDVKL